MRVLGSEITIGPGRYRPRKLSENLTLFFQPIADALIEDSR